MPSFRKITLRESAPKDFQQRATGIHRSVAPDETTALAYHSADFIAIIRSTIPIATMRGLYHAHAIHKNFGFPFFRAMKCKGGIQIIGRKLP